jgi:hypothetical protein
MQGEEHERPTDPVELERWKSDHFREHYETLGRVRLSDPQQPLPAKEVLAEVLDEFPQLKAWMEGRDA